MIRQVEMDEDVRNELDKLLELLADNETIKRFKKIEKQVNENQNIQYLIDEVKRAQKDAVAYAHYGKPEAERVAIKEADDLTESLNQHPLVVAYREAMLSADDLIQSIVSLIEKDVNKSLEKEI